MLAFNTYDENVCFFQSWHARQAIQFDGKLTKHPMYHWADRKHRVHSFPTHQRLNQRTLSQLSPCVVADDTSLCTCSSCSLMLAHRQQWHSNPLILCFILPASRRLYQLKILLVCCCLSFYAWHDCVSVLGTMTRFLAQYLDTWQWNNLYKHEWNNHDTWQWNNPDKHE